VDSSDPKETISLPVKLAVGQVGESTPSKKVVDRLNEENSAISKAVVIPISGYDYGYPSEKPDDIEQFKKRMKGMRKLAKDLDAKYIFLFGGSLAISHSQTWLSFFDITILGAFLVPSNKIHIEGKVSGSLIDVDSGRVLFLVNVEDVVKKSTPSYTSQRTLDKTLALFKDNLMRGIAEEFLRELKSHN